MATACQRRALYSRLNSGLDGSEFTSEQIRDKKMMPDFCTTYGFQQYNCHAP